MLLWGAECPSWCQTDSVKAMNFECWKLSQIAPEPSLSLHFSGHFPGESGLAGNYWSQGWWRWWWQLDHWRYKSCKDPVKSSPPTNQHPVFFTGRMPFLSPNQQCQSTEGKSSPEPNGENQEKKITTWVDKILWTSNRSTPFKPT